MKIMLAWKRSLVFMALSTGKKLPLWLSNLIKTEPWRDTAPGQLDKKMKSAIKLQNAKARFAADAPLILDIDALTIDVGERIALIGPSGAGKTSLLRLINGYLPLESGSMQILGQQVDDPNQNEARQRDIRRRVGFIFQDFSLVERATVFNNV